MNTKALALLILAVMAGLVIAAVQMPSDMSMAVDKIGHEQVRADVDRFMNGEHVSTRCFPWMQAENRGHSIRMALNEGIISKEEADAFLGAYQEETCHR
jgi:hypothetical protein